MIYLIVQEVKAYILNFYKNNKNLNRNWKKESTHLKILWIILTFPVKMTKKVIKIKIKKKIPKKILIILIIIIKILKINMNITKIILPQNTIDSQNQKKNLESKCSKTNKSKGKKRHPKIKAPQISTISSKFPSKIYTSNQKIYPLLQPLSYKLNPS